MSVADELERLSVAEMIEAAALGRAPTPMRTAAALVFRVPSRRLGRILARFDEDVAAIGLARAAKSVVERLGARTVVEGAPPAHGAALVVTNHPGAYDSLATMAAIARDDVALLAAERAFLRAMPNVSRHFVFVTDSRDASNAAGRAAGLRSAVDWLRAGKVLVQYGAGAIEPDARFAAANDVLGEWWAGTGVLAGRAAALGVPVVPLFVSGVHSPRAKRLWIVKAFERRGVTTIAPLVQATLPGFRDVEARLRFGPPIAPELISNAKDARARTTIVRRAVGVLA